MLFAKQVDAKFPLATWGPFPIPEIDRVEVSRKLDAATDIHFGLNGTCATIEEAAAVIKVYNATDDRPECSGLGPRVLDIAQRGGRVAEYNWDIVQGTKLTKGKSGSTIASFNCVTEDWFIGLNDSLETKSSGGNSLKKFPAYARYNNQKPKNLGYFGNSKIRYSGNTKLSGDGVVMGTRWSKTALEFALANNHTIHMHLDGLGDIKGIVTKDEHHAWNFSVTAREVRYLYRHWTRFQNNVRFYNGYQFPKSWKLAAAMQVEVPWKDEPPPPRPLLDPVVVALANKGSW